MTSAPSQMRTQRTFTLDLLRAVPAGVLLTVVTTFAILIANQAFAAPDWAKGVLLAASPLGMLLGVSAVTFVRRSGLTVNQGGAVINAVECGGFLLAAASGWGDGPPVLWMFVLGLSVAMFCMSVSLPLVAQIYRSQYPDEKRGRLFSLAAMVRAGASIAGATVVGKFLAGDMNAYPVALVCFAVASLMVAACVLGMGKVEIQQAKRAKLLDAFRHVKDDKPFLKLLTSWMILGFGNLMAMAMFVEAVANPKYGYAYDADKVTSLTTVIPQVAFILFVYSWGRLFDRWNFYVLRAGINVVFIAGVIVYYCVGGWWGLCIGIALHGIARSGGNVAWSLWTTKFAEPDRVVDYMAVHTFATGIRGTLAPFVALAVAGQFSLATVGAISAGMMTIATLMIVPDIKLAHARRKSQMVVPPKVGS
ncbi:MFS transporter [Sulfuriroseicoccus oceanibius]|uniref:MFS transporter n=1 Tax=Sulfuriroseicoccus oceanibius TaxID=2707525 RepID=A0A7T7F264_9BACT|nr:MFS transporter [Sulfuriroseicoccus oceanibius]QQL45437.1 MFS transporter [Sulfuriroseicoccus oceanibius]